jgi:hypothetical protein
MDESMLSVLNQPSPLAACSRVTTEFSMNHLVPLNRKLLKIADDDNYMEDGEDPQPDYALDENYNSSDMLDHIRKQVPIRRIFPNSNVLLLCSKDKNHYFAVQYEGYSFPMIVKFNMKVLVQVLVSFKYPRPTDLDNDLEFNTFMFQVNKPPEPVDKYPHKLVYMCIKPLCDFKTELSIKFESRDYRIKEQRLVHNAPRKFTMNYKEYMGFSDDFDRNMKNINNLWLKKDQSKVGFNIKALKDFIGKKAADRKRFITAEIERAELAKMKAQQNEFDKLNHISARELARKQHIVNRRLIIESVLDDLVFNTFKRSYIAHHYLVIVMDEMRQKCESLKKQKQLAFRKIRCSTIIINFLCRNKHVVKSETILVTVTGKKDDIFEMKVKDGIFGLSALHIFSKINRIPVYEKALNEVGVLFKRCSQGVILNDLAINLKIRVKNTLRSFRIMISYRRWCINVYSKLFAEIITEIDQTGARLMNSKLKIQGVISSKEITEIVTYLFEYHLYKHICRKVSTSIKGKFITLPNNLRRGRSWVNGAEKCISSKKKIQDRYPHCINIDRLKKTRKEFSGNEPTIIAMRNRTREEQIKKLRSIFTIVQIHFKRDKFQFDFDDIDAKLFLIEYLNLDSAISDTNIEDVLFGVEYRDHEPQREGSLSQPV